MSSPTCSISIGRFDGFTWLKCSGKGSFMNSPILKAAGEARISEGETRLIVDLADCSSMDSTFMGTLAGLAKRVRKENSGSLDIAEAGQKMCDSLLDLGLDALMDINPASIPGHDRLADIRASLHPADAPHPSPDHGTRAIHVLEAHQTLADSNEKNANTFHGVISTLGEQVRCQQADRS